MLGNSIKTKVDITHQNIVNAQLQFATASGPSCKDLQQEVLDGSVAHHLEELSHCLIVQVISDGIAFFPLDLVRLQQSKSCSNFQQTKVDTNFSLIGSHFSISSNTVSHSNSPMPASRYRRHLLELAGTERMFVWRHKTLAWPGKGNCGSISLSPPPKTKFSRSRENPETTNDTPETDHLFIPQDSRCSRYLLPRTNTMAYSLPFAAFLMAGPTNNDLDNVFGEGTCQWFPKVAKIARKCNTPTCLPTHFFWKRGNPFSFS